MLNNGCRVRDPLRGNESTNNCPKYPYKFNNLFVNSENPLSVISCFVIFNKDLESQDFNFNYSCQLLNIKEFTYYITNSSESNIENYKGSLISCSIIDNKNYCREIGNEDLRKGYLY